MTYDICRKFHEFECGFASDTDNSYNNHQCTQYKERIEVCDLRSCRKIRHQRNCRYRPDKKQYSPHNYNPAELGKDQFASVLTFGELDIQVSYVKYSAECHVQDTYPCSYNQENNCFRTVSAFNAYAEVAAHDKRLPRTCKSEEFAV